MRRDPAPTAPRWPARREADHVVDAVHGQFLDGDGADHRAGSSSDPTTVMRAVRAREPLAQSDAVDAIVRRVVARTAGFGPLDPLLTDDRVSEVMVNGPGPVWVERDGQLARTEVHVDVATIERLIERIVAPLGLRVDRASPIVDARLPDGSRVNAVVPPLAIDGPYVTVRRFGVRPVALDTMCSPGVAALLVWAVRSRANILVSGGTGAGKTTLLNMLAGSIPAEERLVTVEDAAELRLPNPHVVRLEARPANADGVGATSVRTLVRNALRMRPDRIVVGEVRGPETLDMLQAMNTGHEGSLSTCHANGPADALRRLETMVLLGHVDLPLAAVRDQLCAALDLLVHVARQADGGRRVVAVAEVLDGDAAALQARPDATGTARVRVLADASGLRELPHRTPRRPDSGPPEPGWIDR
jgi:pilus assembly protein CpaF